MDQRAVFDLVMQLQNVMPDIHQNNRARGAINALREILAVQEEPFIYTAPFPASLAAAGNATFNINIQKDANFKILAGTFMVDLAGLAQVDSTRVIPLVDVLLTDTGSGRAFMDRQVPIEAMFGTGELPFPWPMPKIMKALSTLQVQVFNVSAATAYTNLRLCFIGTKEYALG